jgi:alpha-L-fucosidase
MTFEPTFESVSEHQAPSWFHDAKLGIFIHWGLYSVPGWAPESEDISQIMAEGNWRKWFENNAYAEWYLNSLKFEDGPTRKYHDETYGPDFDYDDFVPMFNDAVKKWNPDEWAGLFQRIGARYVVLTTKHHDGFTLWPTEHPCPRKPGYHTERDLVGELTEAVRSRGLRMGLYYSGGLDWAFNDTRIEDITEVWSTIVQDPEFVAYVGDHWHELIAHYKPSVLWNDIGSPVAFDVPGLFAHYYNTILGGVVNNRFAQPGIETSDEQIVSHHDFVTPEYTTFDTAQEEKWESCRGIGHSFGYNRAEGTEEMLSGEELVRMFADIVSKNGNLLVNVGPMADGTIPQNQREPLEALGAWLDVNGEAIFGTRPWIKAESMTDQGVGVRFTQQGSAVYAILLGTPEQRSIKIEDLQVDGVNTTVQLLGGAEVLPWGQEGEAFKVTLPDKLPESPSHCLKIMPERG